MKQKHYTALGLMTILFLLIAVFATMANAQTQTFVYKKPVCMPKALSELRWSWTDLTFVALWYCDTPRGIATNVRAFDVSKAPQKLTTIVSKSAAELYKLDAAVINRNLTPAEATAANALGEAEGIKARVVNGSYATAPTYSRMVDGTRGETTETRVAVGSPCNWSMRLVSITDGVETGTNYYAVVGEVGLYARCAISGVISK